MTSQQCRFAPPYSSVLHRAVQPFGTLLRVPQLNRPNLQASLWTNSRRRFCQQRFDLRWGRLHPAVARFKSDGERGNLFEVIPRAFNWSVMSNCRVRWSSPRNAMMPERSKPVDRADKLFLGRRIFLGDIHIEKRPRRALCRNVSQNEFVGRKLARGVVPPGRSAFSDGTTISTLVCAWVAGIDLEEAMIVGNFSSGPKRFCCASARAFTIGLRTRKARTRRFEHYRRHNPAWTYPRTCSPDPCGACHFHR